jgi:apoptosis-inducing factor 3
MSQGNAKRTGPDLFQGVPLDDLPEGGTLIGHVDKDEVLLVRVGHEVFATSPYCTHYQGPLGEGLVVGRTVRCPWHHARFDLCTGEALRAPALDPIACWDVDLEQCVDSAHSRNVERFLSLV